MTPRPMQQQPALNHEHYGGQQHARLERLQQAIERLMRDAPFMLIGEGTSEIQKMIISKRLLDEYRI